MPKEVMDVKASDNVYLHRDFHGALSTGIEYLDKTYGKDAVVAYLKQFTRDFYRPLIEDIQSRGLIAIKEHYDRIYQIEEVSYKSHLSDDELTIQVEGNTPVQHMRKHGYRVADMFIETVKTVNETLCEGTAYKAELLDYNQDTGTSITRFSRK